MKIMVNIEKKHVYLISGLLVLFTSIFLVNAFGGVNPSVMGHNSGEVDLSGYYTKAQVDSMVGGVISKTSSEYTQTSAGTLNMGSHAFCSLAGFSDYSLDGVHCYVKKTGSVWYLEMLRPASSAGSWCRARCLDF